MQTIAQAPAVARFQCVQARSSVRSAAPVNAKAGKASAQRLASVASVKAATATLRASAACRAAGRLSVVSVSAVSYVEPEHVRALMAADPEVYFMDVRSEPEVRNGIRPQFDRRHYFFNPVLNELEWGIEPNREFAPYLKDMFRGGKKDNAKILICDKDGGERSVIAFGKMVELGYKAKVIRGGYDAFVAVGAA